MRNNIVNNMPKDHDRFVVARRDEQGFLWYWGSWDSRDAANNVADSFDNGEVIDCGEV